MEMQHSGNAILETYRRGHVASSGDYSDRW